MHWKRFVREFLGIFLGSTISAIGLNMFLVPNKLAAGGASGLGIILFHTFGIPVGLTIIAFNVLLFLFTFKYLGVRFLAHTVSGTVLMSLMVEVLSFLPAATNDILLAAVYGGLVLGVGMGIVFRANGSTGGTALAAQLLHRLFGVSSGQGLIGSDILIVGAAGIIFGAEIGLYAALSLFVSSWLVDVIQEGFSLAKAALIITSKDEELAKKLMQHLDRGVTRMEAWGGYTDERRGILLSVVSRNQTTQLKALVYEVDPHAFIIVGNASEVLGEGFRQVDEHSR
ncbi:MAG: YitT family protein [Firmicutes bacterium]|jgi:uncharacterized membrane-anchored protein YitT (DUF2179 family)|nr:YitT family protein [Bacillota bacterium]